MKNVKKKIYQDDKTISIEHPPAFSINLGYISHFLDVYNVAENKS